MFWYFCLQGKYDSGFDDKVENLKQRTNYYVVKEISKFTKFSKIAAAINIFSLFIK